MEDLSKTIKSTFKLHGYNLNVETTKYIIEVINEIKQEQRNGFIDKLLDELSKRNIESSTSLNKTIIADIVKEINFDVKESKDKIFFIIDSFQVPKYYYCEQKKKFLKSEKDSKNDEDNSKSTIADSTDKINLFFQRYTIMYQRTIRHELFSPSVINSANTSMAKKKFQLKPIEHLLSHTSHTGEIIVLGMLSQLKENKFYLEDPTGSVPLDLTEAKYHSGIYTEGCFVLVEGRFEEGTFFVRAIGFPPAELESVTRSYFGNINYFGGPNEINCKSINTLKQIESTLETMIVFISDVWLDSPKIMEKLQLLFSGYSDAPPYAFVLCGNFLSKQRYGLRCEELADAFKQLADLICQFSTIRDNSQFIFIPGPQDPGVVKIYPRAGILSHCTEYIRKKVKNCHFPSNPCRIQFCTRQIVVFREDMIQKMTRNAIKMPDPNTLAEDLAKTIICQAHLSPLPLHVVPVYWNYDHSMRMYPLPDLIVIADSKQTYTETHNECTVMNPGSFPVNNFSFKAYIPSTNTLENCQLPSN